MVFIPHHHFQLASDSSPFHFSGGRNIRFGLYTQDQFLKFDFTFSFGVYLGKLIAQDHEQLKIPANFYSGS
ncbi:hypothetical protein L1887_16736 [Cichorium endivia]|nr:hypothetical protein L1887_16736 [Cichorium endivia]